MTNSNPRLALLYPIMFFGGALFLCAWTLTGNRIFAALMPLEHPAAELDVSEAGS